jgi:phosphopantetheine--protein transferase-like protein
MAVRGGMKNLLTSRGVELLPADAGADLAVNLIAAGVTGELVVSGGLGDFNPTPNHPLLDTLEYDQDGVITTHNFSVENDPWVVDHAIDGTPVLPGVIGLELMTATAALLAPNEPLVGAADVSFLKPVKAHKGGDVALTMSAVPTKTPGAFTASLSSSRTLRTGRVQTTEHFTATVLFGEQHKTQPLPSLLMPDENITANEIYARFFHGPKFQVLTGTSSVAADGLLTGAATQDDAIASPFVSTPLALESAFQAAGLHRMITDAIMGLPERFERVEVINKVPDNTPLEVLVLKRGDVYDVDVTANGSGVLRLRGFSLVDFGPLSGDKLFPGLSQKRPDCVQLGGTNTTAASGPIAFSNPSDNATAWLTSRELTNLRARGTQRRIADRIAGRIAAKRALANHGLDPKQFEIENNQAGAPILRPDIGLHLSISHTDGVGVAILSSAPIGIDAEPITERTPAFLAEWFTEQERVLLAQDPTRITLAWCAKEATMKTLGKGMALHPQQIEVTAIGPDSVEIQLHAQARDEASLYNINNIQICWSNKSDKMVIAIAKVAA